MAGIRPAAAIPIGPPNGARPQIGRRFFADPRPSGQSFQTFRAPAEGK